MTPPPNRHRALGLRLDGLADIVADHHEAERLRAHAPPREGWRWRLAGWMGVMYGPLPVSHLLIGLTGLYFRLR